MLQNAGQRCPHVEAPFPECFINDLSSASIERAIVYCGGDFEGCDIYATHHFSKGSGAATADDSAAQLQSESALYQLHQRRSTMDK